MIRVTVELVPNGDVTQKRVIGAGSIWNDGSGTKCRGNYQYEIWSEEDPYNLLNGEIKGFQRLLKPAWDLVFQVVLDLIAHRKKENCK